MSPSSHKLCLRGQRAFTLIELLVVISIISLLIAILLPALGAARDSAKSVICLNNQRSIGLSMFNYAHDNKDYFVPAKTSGVFNTLPAAPDNSEGKYAWPAMLKHLNYMPSGALHDDPSWKYFHCESAPNRPGVGTYDSPGWYTYFSSYGYNAHQIGASLDLLPSGNAANYTPARTGDIVDASSKLLMIDTVSVNSGISDGRGYNRIAQSNGSGVAGRPDARHRGSANIVWTDGHASSLKSPDPADYGSMYSVLGTGGVGSLGNPNVWNRLDRGLSPY